MYELHPRRVDVFVKDVGFEQGNSVQTLATRDVTEEEPEPEPLDQVQLSKYRSHVATYLFRQSRPSRHIIMDELCQTGRN